MSALSLINYFELCAFFISIGVYANLKETPLRLFPFFLGFIVLTELVAKYIHARLFQQDTGLNTIATTTSFVFYAFIFRAYLQHAVLKKIVAAFIVIYPLLTMVDWIFLRATTSEHSYTQLMAAVSMIFFCCCFFYELLLNPVEEQLRRDPMFWICTGILFFHLGSLSYTLLYNFLQRYAASEGRKVFQSINNNLILMLYSCFIIAFLCKRSLRKSSLR